MVGSNRSGAKGARGTSGGRGASGTKGGRGASGGKGASGAVFKLPTRDIEHYLYANGFDGVIAKAAGRSARGNPTSVIKSALGHMNLWTQMDDFAKGIVDTRHVVYQLSVGVLFLFLAAKSLEVKKWR